MAGDKKTLRRHVQIGTKIAKVLDEVIQPALQHPHVHTSRAAAALGVAEPSHWAARKGSSAQGVEEGVMHRLLT